MAEKGKNKRRQLTAYDYIHNKELSVDSAEEVDTLNWLCEAKTLSIINDFEYQPESFKLFDDVKYQDATNKTRCLFRGHAYTADWALSFTPSTQIDLAKEFKVPYSELSNDDYKVYLDSKGTFNKTERAFGYNQKWVWQKFKTYIYKFVPKIFFEKFGVPEKSQLTGKTNKPRKMFLGFKTLKEMLNR